jgi:hypothetical protein
VIDRNEEDDGDMELNIDKIPKNIINMVNEENMVLFNMIKKYEEREEEKIQNCLKEMDTELNEKKLHYINKPDFNLNDFGFKVKNDERLTEKSFFLYCLDENEEYYIYEILKDLFIKKLYDKNKVDNEKILTMVLNHFKIEKPSNKEKIESYKNIYLSFIISSRYYCEALLLFNNKDFEKSIEFFYDCLLNEYINYRNYPKLKRYLKIEK